MRAVILLLAGTLGISTAVPTSPIAPKIIGGSLTTIDQYPFGAALLVSQTGSGTFIQSCGGTVINNRAILTAAHCFDSAPLSIQHRIRVGSSFASSGGIVHNVNAIIIHPNYSAWTVDSDIAIMHSATAFTFTSTVQTASIAGANYHVADNQEVWAIGWGIADNGSPSEQLRHVQIWTVNQDICRSRYGSLLTDNMLCSGVLDVGGRDQCSQDSGGPLLHNNIVVGVCSFGNICGDPYYPGVNVRVSKFTSWIVTNA